MKRWLSATICLLAFLLWLPQGVAAAEPPAPTEGTATEADLRDPEALAELRRATDFLVALPRFRLRASATYDVIQEDGRRLQFEKQGDIYVQRPNRLFAEVRLDDGRWRQFWYDGETIALAERSKNLHAQVKAPPTLDATLDMMEKLIREPLPLADLLYGDLRPLEQRALEADVVGDSVVNGRPCRHLAFRGQTVDWQLWVEQGANPFIRKLAITYVEEAGTPQYVASIDVWETPETFGDDRFRFVVPPGSARIEVLAPASRRTERGDRP